MRARLVNPDFSSDRLEASVVAILNNVVLCSMSTTTPSGESYIHTAYFCFDDLFNLYFVSDPATTHCRNLACSPSTAVAVYATDQPWDAPHKGLQLFGMSSVASTIESIKALKLHACRFHAYAEYLKSLSPLEKDSTPYKFFVFRPRLIKIFDEPEFGEETFITAEIERN